jgi:D-alanine-D-alanine ligase
MKKKIRVGIIFGGRSSEHEVSLVSATSIIQALDKEKYDVIPIGITKEGKWLSSARTLALLKEGKNLDQIPERVLLPDPTQKGLVNFRSDGLSTTNEPLDVVFPVLHGPYGEDGTIQGLLDLANIPYVGAGVLASALGMDKVLQKQVFERAGLTVTEYVSFLLKEYKASPAKWIREIEKKFSYPCFVKPANLGSSVGITKAHSRKELRGGIVEAGRYDRKILVERSIENAREIECSVLGNDDPRASVPGEVVPSNEFYDYDAKYIDGKSEIIVPATLPKKVAKKVQEIAVKAFKAIDCAGMARVDFLVTRDRYEIYICEVNTIPGFTTISMYPKLWEASGLSYTKLLDTLIRLAIERYHERNRLETSFHPRSGWYKES